MYSVVLATMLTAGAQTTGFGWHNRGGGCHGCHGCQGVHTYNAFSGCSGCSSFCGGNGGWCHGCSRARCHGCHGCGGVTVVLGGCHGCNGCYSSCRGGYSTCHGCYSSCHGSFSSCHGCSGGGVVQQQAVGARPADRMAARNEAERQAAEEAIRKLRESKKDRREEEREEASVPSNKARVVVRVPADARLWVDQVECPLPGTVRSFDTPNLNPEQNYAYTLRIAIQRNGQTVQDSRRVQVVAGRQVDVDFSTVGAERTAQR